MLIGPFRMYFVKKRVKWDLVDARSQHPAAGTIKRHKKTSENPLTFGAKRSTPAIL